MLPVGNQGRAGEQGREITPVITTVTVTVTVTLAKAWQSPCQSVTEVY